MTSPDGQMTLSISVFPNVEWRPLEWLLSSRNDKRSKIISFIKLALTHPSQIALSDQGAMVIAEVRAIFPFTEYAT